jgi:predicted Zn-dependent protease
MRYGSLMVCWLVLTGTAWGDVPVTARPQVFVFSQSEVELAESKRFAGLTNEFRLYGELDTDPEAGTRVLVAVQRLAAAAGALVPDQVGLAWEVHTTANPDVDGISMAGGKLLVGLPFINAMDLTDSELAMVLAHEMAHVLGHHHNETLSNAFILAFRNLPSGPVPFVGLAVSAMQANPGLVLGMGPLTRMQELEADALGLLLASRAGYPTAELVRFFEKLADKDGAAGVSESSTHPSGAIRLLYAKAVSQLIGAGMFGS